MTSERGDGVLGVVLRQGRLLVIRRSESLDNAPGRWTPPGGRVEPGETQADAVVRELREECRIEVEPEAKFAECMSEDGHWNLHWWRARLVSGVAEPACDEVADVRWVDFAELEALPDTFAKDLDILGSLFE